MECIGLEPGVSQGSPLLFGQHHPIAGSDGSEVTGAEALRIESELAPFP